MATINSANIYQTPNAAGSILYPGQSAFNAYMSSTTTNQTGDGTVYGPVIFDSELFDQNSDYNTGTGNFTAPVSGRYMFGGGFDIRPLTASHTIILIQIVTSNRTYRVFDSTTNIRYTFGGANILRFPFAVFADMDAADTAYVELTVSNGTKTVGVLGSGTPATGFSFWYGFLMT
jgi:C1q domain-containing protein